MELDRVTARTLQSLGIDIQDAETANVTRMPSVPSVVPRTDLGPTSRQAPAANPQQPTGQSQLQMQAQPTPAQAQMQAAPQSASATPKK